MQRAAWYTGLGLVGASLTITMVLAFMESAALGAFVLFAVGTMLLMVGVE